MTATKKKKNSFKDKLDLFKNKSFLYLTSYQEDTSQDSFW